MNPFSLEQNLENVLEWEKDDIEQSISIPQEGITEWMEFPEMKFTYKIELLEHDFDLNRFENTPEIHKEIEAGFKPFAMFNGKGMMDKVCIKIDYSNKVLYYRLGDYKSTHSYLSDFVSHKYKSVRDYWRQIGMYNRLLHDFFMQYLSNGETEDVSLVWDIRPDVRILAIQTNEWANLKDIKIGIGDLINSQRGGFINPITSFSKSGEYTDIFMQQNNPFYGYNELYKKGVEQVIMTYWDNMSDELQDSLRTDENGVYLMSIEEAIDKWENSESLDLDIDELV